MLTGNHPTSRTMNSLRLSLTAWLLAPSLVMQAADFRVATLFADHMVLQREKPVPVWGWGDPGETVTVEFGDQRKSASAGADGRWMVKLEPLPASSEPRKLTVRSGQAGRQVEISDVLVGEVWLGSGQSNMAMTVSKALQPDQEKAAAQLPLLRHFHESSRASSTPQELGSGSWAICAPETAGAFSATLYFFGREIHRELQVPVGLINSSVGGTPIESWIAPEAQQGVPELQAFVEASQKHWDSFDPAAAKAAYEKALAAWKIKAQQAKAAGKPAPRKPQEASTVRDRKGGLGGLFHGKISPLIPYALRGAVWYQGEANSHSGKSLLYRYQLPLLVSDWRSRWGEEFPFAWVQLPNYERSGEGWPLVREAMLLSLRLPRTGMAITVDIGDPGNIHPQNKQEVGRRLALWALGEVYGKSVPSTCGPLPAGKEVRGKEIRLSFAHAEGGLQSGGEEMKGFVIAGEDRQWQPAQARIEGSQVMVSSELVPQPVAVRYAWSDNPDCNLRNGAGLPASPFRTDDWPIQETP